MIWCLRWQIRVCVFIMYCVYPCIVYIMCRVYICIYNIPSFGKNLLRIFQHFKEPWTSYVLAWVMHKADPRTHLKLIYCAEQRYLQQYESRITSRNLPRPRWRTFLSKGTPVGGRNIYPSGTSQEHQRIWCWYSRGYEPSTSEVSHFSVAGRFGWTNIHITCWNRRSQDKGIIFKTVLAGEHTERERKTNRDQDAKMARRQCSFFCRLYRHRKELSNDTGRIRKIIFIRLFFGGKTHLVKKFLQLTVHLQQEVTPRSPITGQCP